MGDRKRKQQIVRTLALTTLEMDFRYCVDTKNEMIDEFGHCRLYLGDGCTFSCRQENQSDDQEETQEIAPNRADEGLRWEASNPAKLARHQKYQLQKIRKSRLSSSEKQKSLPERRNREDPAQEQQQQNEEQRPQQRQICFWESEGCPVLWSKNDENEMNNEIFSQSPEISSIVRMFVALFRKISIHFVIS